MTGPHGKAPIVLSERRPLLSGSSLLGVCGSLAGDVSPLRDVAVAALTGRRHVAPGGWALGGAPDSERPGCFSCPFYVLAAWGCRGYWHCSRPTEGRRQRNWTAGSGPGGESCGKEQRHSTLSLRVRCHLAGLSGHWREPVGSGASLTEPWWPAPGPDRPAGRGCQPAGGYRRERLHHSGGVMVQPAARDPSSPRRFMDQLTFPACSLFITSTCNDELKILLHEACLYCLMDPRKEASS